MTLGLDPVVRDPKIDIVGYRPIVFFLFSLHHSIVDLL